MVVNLWQLSLWLLLVYLAWRNIEFKDCRKTGNITSNADREATRFSRVGDWNRNGVTERVIRARTSVPIENIIPKGYHHAPVTFTQQRDPKNRKQAPSRSRCNYTALRRACFFPLSNWSALIKLYVPRSCGGAAVRKKILSSARMVLLRYYSPTSCNEPLPGCLAQGPLGFSLARKPRAEFQPAPCIYANSVV